MATFAQNKFIKFNNKDIYYEGRIAYTDTASILTWPGSAVKINFKGTELKAVLRDTDSSDYFNVIIDKNKIYKIHPGKLKSTYILASGLPYGNHSVELFKRTESDKGHCLFYGFSFDGSLLRAQSFKRKRFIEYYGNSITCGYAIEDSTGDSGKGYLENNYLSYAAITARHFNATFYCIAKSGIGVTVSWFPLIMPEMYDRLIESEPNVKWNFKTCQPDIVVIDLFQNDSWIVNMKQNPQYIARLEGRDLSDSFFINSYYKFLLSIRSKYKRSKIICTLGSMDASKDGSIWKTYISAAVDQMKDPDVLIHFFPYKNTPGHPKIAEQRAMAESLITFISRKVKW